MSQENVEALQRAVEANNRRDYDAFLAELDPDIEWHGIFEEMFGRAVTVIRGREDLLAYLLDADEAFDFREIEWSEFRDLGDRVVGLGHVRARGRESRVEFDSQYAGLAEFRDGTIVRYTDYFDHGNALAAAGLAD